MSLRIKIFFSSLFYFLLSISNAYAVNKISVFGTIENMDGQLLSDALITLKNQNKSAVTNRFGEFDLGKIFPDDTIIVTLKGFQKNKFIPSSNMKIKLFPKSFIQELINNARNGDTVIIPPGIHYIYPDFNVDSTTGVSINYKANVTIMGSDNSEIRLMTNSANIFYIYESTNIQIRNITVGYLESEDKNIEIISTAQAVDYSKALTVARQEIGENSIFKYDGKLRHTKGYLEPFNELELGNIIKVVNSSDIVIENSILEANGNICIGATNSKNISLEATTLKDGIYGLAIDSSDKIIVSNSFIFDNGEIFNQHQSQLFFSNNIIKISGYFVPEFVMIDGGSIEMLDETVIPPPKPTYLTADSFKISKQEITFEQFDSFCLAKGKETPDDSEWGRGNRPVINISYQDALDYCLWLGELTGKTIRLPKINEWEYAARGGVKGGDDNSYSGGNILETVAWCKYNTKGKTEPVGLKDPNELGLYDMSGNVYEFCLATNDSMIILKGGSWANSGVGCRISDEVVSKINYWDDNIGFRVIEEL